jgi:orotate phosphoribosyltransferase
VQGHHVLVLDDMWTTGSNAQSAALALRRAGAAAVSVMVVGRWLNPSYGHTGEFIKTRLQRDYDPDMCPVTGASCP